MAFSRAACTWTSAHESAARLVELDLPGYAVGGLSVGEGHEAMVEVLGALDEQLPREKPRYLMGVGEPRDILAAVAAGVDMFDCVLPTRNGRNAQAFTWGGHSDCETSATPATARRWRKRATAIPAATSRAAR